MERKCDPAADRNGGKRSKGGEARHLWTWRNLAIRGAKEGAVRARGRRRSRRGCRRRRKRRRGRRPRAGAAPTAAPSPPTPATTTAPSRCCFSVKTLTLTLLFGSGAMPFFRSRSAATCYTLLHCTVDGMSLTFFNFINIYNAFYLVTTPSVPNYRSFDFFDIKFNHSSYSKKIVQT